MGTSLEESTRTGEIQLIWTGWGGVTARVAFIQILALLDRHSGIYIEIHDGILLAFCPDRDLETTEGIEALFGLGSLLCSAE